MEHIHRERKRKRRQQQRKLRQRHQNYSGLVQYTNTAYSIYLKKWQSKYYHQIQIKKKTNNNHNQVVHNITSL
ncbi:hypothetical protein F6P96_10385 [Escherichia coli]|nr:hypothetical protein F6P96_10385 [Escherichia coli]